MPIDIIYKEDIRQRMLSGINQHADAIRITLGPKGRNTVIEKASASPLITNDGATIAKEIELEDSVENMGVRMIKEVALKTNEAAGDGTTTATVLSHFIISEGFKNVQAGADPIELKKGIEGATQLSAAAIKRLSKPVRTHEAVEQVASISAEDTEIGRMIADAMEQVGMDGVTTIEESKSLETTLNVKSGMQMEKGYISPEMVTDKQRMVAELQNPYILITDKKITDPFEIAPLLEKVAEKKRPLLIIAEAVEAGALGMLLMNNKKGVLAAVAVHPPAYGEGRRARMEDLAVMTGGTFITEDLGYVLREATLDMLGTAVSVSVKRLSTAIVNGGGGKREVAERISQIRMLIDKTEHDFDRTQLQERLGKLTKGVAAIQVGAFTETGMKEKKLRIDDALHAARAAVAEGIVPGGGLAYLKIIPAVKAFVDTLSGDMKTGASIILKALEEPARQIAENAGLDGRSVVAECMRRPSGVGFNAASGEYSDLMQDGVVDSVRVLSMALRNAASVSAILLTTEACIVDA